MPLKRYRLICFDMDGTLIYGTTADMHFASLFSLEKPVRALEEEYREGRLSSDEFMVKIALILQDLTTDFIREHFESLPLVEGIPDVLSTLRANSVVSVLATSSTDVYANCFKERYGFDYAFGAKHEIGAGNRIGVGVVACDSREKAACLEAVCAKHGIDLNETVGIGDSLSDTEILARVGLAIAFNSDSALEGKADVYIRSRDLRAILPHVFCGG